MEELDRINSDCEAILPNPLTSFDNWVNWEEHFFMYCTNMRSARTPGIPFSYLICPHADVSALMLDTGYVSINEDLIATTLLAGGAIEHDNHQLYDFLKGLLQDGAAAPFLQPHNCTRNGCVAYLVVKAQAKGQAAMTSCKAKA